MNRHMNGTNNKWGGALSASQNIVPIGNVGTGLRSSHDRAIERSREHSREQCCAKSNDRSNVRAMDRSKKATKRSKGLNHLPSHQETGEVINPGPRRARDRMTKLLGKRSANK